MTKTCLKCKSREVCKVIDIIKELSDIVVLTVEECYVNQEENLQEKAPELAQPVMTPVPKKDYKNLRGLRTPVGAPKMSVMEFTPTDNVEIKVSEKAHAKELKQCGSCEAIAFDGDVTPCPGCGVDTCDSCGTQDADSGQRLCENCWGK